MSSLEDTSLRIGSLYCKVSGQATSLAVASQQLSTYRTNRLVSWPISAGILLSSFEDMSLQDRPIVIANV